MPMKQTSGFTLVELMIAVAVLAILLAIGLPSFQSSFRSNRVATASNELLTSFTLARSEAIRSTRGAGVCASANGTSCVGSWNDGWLVWGDANSNGALDAGETVVRYSQARPALAMNGSAASVAYDGRGRVVGGPKNIGLKPEGYETPARFLCINGTGQARIQESACP